MMAMRGPLHANSSQPSQVRKEAATTTKAVPGQGLASFLPMAILHLSLKRVYFEQIQRGEKPLEFRLCTPHWEKRLLDRTYDGIVLSLGYPAAGDQSRRLYRQWLGATVQTIEHPHFGPTPVQVFAIDVAHVWVPATII